MKRAAVTAVLVAAAVGAPGAGADTVTQPQLPWASPPFTSFSQNLVTTDPAGDVYALATGSSSTYVAAFNSTTDTKLGSVGGGNGYVQISLPSGSHAETIAVQGSLLVAAGSAPGGAFVQSYNLGNGTSSGPTIVNAPGGTSFSATAGNATPASGGGTRVVIGGVDSISLSPMLFTVNVAGGAVGPSSLCPNQFNLLTASPVLAISSIAANPSGQILVGGVQLPSTPGVGSVNGTCTTVTSHPLAQPSGQTNDGFVTALSGLPNGNFIVGTDMSTGSGAAIQANLVLPTGLAVPGTTPFQGPSVPSASVTGVFPLGSGSGLVGAQRTAVPVPGAFFRFDASGKLVQDSPAPFTDSNHADVVPQFAAPVDSHVSIGGLGSPTSGPNTLDIWNATTTVQPPPCTPKLSSRKTVTVYIQATLGAHSTLTLPAPFVRSPTVGEYTVFTIEVTNSGDCVADDVTVTDALPAAYRPNGTVSVEQEGRFEFLKMSGQTITVRIGHLAPHSSARVHIYGHVSRAVYGHVSRAGSLNNHAAVAASGVAAEPTNELILSAEPPGRVTHIKATADQISGTVAPAKLTNGHVDPVARVNVAIDRPGAHGSCAWLTRTGAFKPTKGGCAAISWLRARGTKKFSLHLKRLRPGTYLALVQPVSRSGVAEGFFGLTRPDMELFRVPRRAHR